MPSSTSSFYTLKRKKKHTQRKLVIYLRSHGSYSARTRAQATPHNTVNGLLMVNKGYNFIYGGKHMTIVSSFLNT